MSLENVKAYFQPYDMADKIIELAESSATVTLAAEALNRKPEQIAKSLSFKLKKTDETILIVTAGDAKIDNQLFKNYFGERATMLKGSEVLERTGHPIGGVCPFALPSSVKVYLDDSLKRFETVLPACGSSKSAIELTIPQLEKYAPYQAWINIYKDWQA